MSGGVGRAGEGGSGGIHAHLSSGWLPEHSDDDFKDKRYRYGTWQGSLDEFCQHFQHEEIENAAAYNSHGQQLFHIIGDDSSIKIPSRFRDRMKDGVLIHNHPDPASSFSAEDLISAALCNLKKVVVVTALPDKTVVHTLQRIGSNWQIPIPTPEEYKTENSIIQLTYKASRKAAITRIMDEWEKAFGHRDKERAEQLLRRINYYTSYAAMKFLAHKYGTFKIREEVF